MFAEGNTHLLARSTTRFRERRSSDASGTLAAEMGDGARRYTAYKAERRKMRCPEGAALWREATPLCRHAKCVLVVLDRFRKKLQRRAGGREVRIRSLDRPSLSSSRAYLPQQANLAEGFLKLARIHLLHVRPHAGQLEEYQITDHLIALWIV